ncbi:helix-turn-helix transcriptional regulator [Aurantivibrio infirmus]
MSQTIALVNTLKRQLKAQGKTYADVAVALDLSEASVKRLFSEHNFTLERLDTLCRLLGMDFAELVQQMDLQQKQMTELTLEQEQEIASDIVQVLVAVCVINGYTFAEIIEQYKLKETDLIQKLAKLDRLKIIELLPNNRIKLLVSRNFSWLRSGPIQKFFLDKVASDFFHSHFDRESEQLLVFNGLLSKTKNALLHEKMKRLAQEFNEMAQDDMALPLDKRFGNTLVLAVRQWRYSLFDQFTR